MRNPTTIWKYTMAFIENDDRIIFQRAHYQTIIYSIIYNENSRRLLFIIGLSTFHSSSGRGMAILFGHPPIVHFAVHSVPDCSLRRTFVRRSPAAYCIFREWNNGWLAARLTGGCATTTGIKQAVQGSSCTDPHIE